MRVRIEGTALPGRHCGSYTEVHVAVQWRREPFEPVAGDAERATWEFDVTTKAGPGGGTDIGGPFAQGRRGERFLYLTWGTAEPDGGFAMFRRAKLMVDDIDPDALARAARGEGALVGRLGLTDSCGMPVCARVRPPAITWTVEPS